MAASTREEIARLDAAAKTAMDAITAAQQALSVLTPADVVPTGSPEMVTEWWGVYFSTLATLADGLDDLRTIRAQIRRRAQRGIRLYVVRPGDTLESIARQALRNAARGDELGVRPEELTPGRVIRLPEGG